MWVYSNSFEIKLSQPFKKQEELLAAALENNG